MDSYIIRIYQRSEKNSSSLVGMVEEVGIEGRKPFRNYDELWEILTSPMGGGIVAESPAHSALRGRKKRRKT